MARARNTRLARMASKAEDTDSTCAVDRALLLCGPFGLGFRRLGRPGPRQGHARTGKCCIGAADQQQAGTAKGGQAAQM